jgi:hypothetical protein
MQRRAFKLHIENSSETPVGYADFATAFFFRLLFLQATRERNFQNQFGMGDSLFSTFHCSCAPVLTVLPCAPRDTKG